MEGSNSTERSYGKEEVVRMKNEPIGIMEGLQESVRQITKVKVITICAMMIALAIIINQFSFSVGEYIKIGFSTHVNQVVFMLFGGTVGMIFGGVADIVKFIIKPDGAFQIGYTLVPMLAGLIYGIFYYKKKMTFWRILAAQATVALICNIILNTFLLVTVSGLRLEVILIPRIIRNVVMLPINTCIFYMIVQALEGARIRSFLD